MSAEASGPRLTPVRFLGLAGFGAVALSICDGFHTASGTTRYTGSSAGQGAWLSPLIFGLAAGLGGPVFAFLYRALGGKKAPPSWFALVPAFAAFAGLYYFSGFYKGTNEVKLAVLSGATLVLYALLDRTFAGAACTLLLAAVGPIVEVILIRQGVFEHLQPDYLGVPIWLPALYACSGPTVGQGARRWLGAR